MSRNAFKDSKHDFNSCFFSQDDEESAGFALDGLKQVMAVKSRSVLPYLVPKVKCHSQVFLFFVSFLLVVSG